MTMRQKMDLALEQRHGSLDIALDTFPFEGMTTTFLALCIGVPVVSFAGPDHRTRVGFSIVANAGLPELAARSYDAYVAAAVKLAFALEALSALRATLRQRPQNSMLMAWTALCPQRRGGVSPDMARLVRAEVRRSSPCRCSEPTSRASAAHVGRHRIRGKPAVGLR